MCFCLLSCFNHVWLCVTLWTIACQVPLSMEFTRPEYWSGLPCSPAGDRLYSGIKTKSHVSCIGRGFFFFFFFLPLAPSGKPFIYLYILLFSIKAICCISSASCFWFLQICKYIMSKILRDAVSWKELYLEYQLTFILILLLLNSETCK